MRTMDIEALLRWAYVEELPRFKVPVRLPAAAASAWGSVESYAQLLTVIDCNKYGVVPDLAALAFPHPDAFVVADAVCELDRLELALPDDWQPFADIAGDAQPLAARAAVRAIDHVTVFDENGQRRLRRPLFNLILRHVIMRSEPDWETEPFEIKVERNTFGQPAWYRRMVVGEGREAREIEVEGFCYKRRRPFADAYQRFYLEPDAKPVAIARAEYELWHAALAFLADELAGKLESIRVTSSARPARPWETGRYKGPRILVPTN